MGDNKSKMSEWIASSMKIDTIPTLEADQKEKFIRAVQEVYEKGVEVGQHNVAATLRKVIEDNNIVMDDTIIQYLEAIEAGQMENAEAYNRNRARMSKDDYYLNIAEAVLGRSTCLRRRYGAIIVKNDEIIATGYNGSCRGDENCIDLGYCYREANNIPAGQMYERCVAVHAEENAIISAARKDMLGATIYIAGREVKTWELANPAPCIMCRRKIKNAGIVKVIGKTSGGPKEIEV